MFGALAVAELGAMMPRAGGQFVFLKEIYGPLWGFLYGWAGFTVIISASISAIAVGFATYLGYFFSMDAWSVKIVAIASIALLTAANCLEVRLGAFLQNGFTFAKIAALGLLALVPFFLWSGITSNFRPVLPPAIDGSYYPLFMLAMVSVLWAYDGWIEVTFVAGEVKNPERTIHRSLIIATLLVVALYVVVNLAFIFLLSLSSMAQSSLVASDAAQKMLGAVGASFIALAVVVSTFGANNGFVFTGARIYYAMAREGLFFQSFSTIHSKFNTPVHSLVGQGIWSCLLVLTGSYDQLITYVVFVSWIFYAMSAAGVIVLRKREPHRERPYRTWGYPWTPVVFILFALYLVVSSVVENPRDSMFGVLLTVSGIPLYFWWKNKKPDA
jgi:APA family basic amino acid/polyamine antiporter